MDLTLPLYQIDAFSQQPFAGNPAAVVPLPHWLPDSTLQAIAAENNLSETAFFVVDEALPRRLRWFTPSTEVDLCGHATLAAAWVLFHIYHAQEDALTFTSQGGDLVVRRQGAMLELDFPARAPAPVAADKAVLQALGVPHADALLQSRDLIVVLQTEQQVRDLQPDFAALAAIDSFAICVTAPGDNCDFVSRFFAPRQGINEDPVTGSAHCSLTPYWQQRLGRNPLRAQQLSARGGELTCRQDAQRVLIAGHACCYLKGEIFLAGVER